MRAGLSASLQTIETRTVPISVEALYLLGSEGSTDRCNRRACSLRSLAKVHRSRSRRGAVVVLGAGAWYQQDLVMLLAFWARLVGPRAGGEAMTKRMVKGEPLVGAASTASLNAGGERKGPSLRAESKWAGRTARSLRRSDRPGL